MAMFGYMTTNYDSIDMTKSLEIEASGGFPCSSLCFRLPCMLNLLFLG